jgi:hypothetical protein
LGFLELLASDLMDKTVMMVCLFQGPEVLLEVTELREIPAPLE